MVLQFEYPHPLAPYDRDKEVALLRASIIQMEAGEQGRSVEDILAEIDRELDQPSTGEDSLRCSAS